MNYDEFKQRLTVTAHTFYSDGKVKVEATSGNLEFTVAFIVTCDYARGACPIGSEIDVEVTPCL